MTSVSRYLWLDVEVSAESGDALELLQLSHASTFPVERTLRLAADASAGTETNVGPDASAGEVTLRVDAEEPRVFRDALDRAEWAYGHVHNTLMDGAHDRGWHRIHAALLEVRGVGVIVAGHSGAGKTSLAVHAAERGAGLHSDEGVLLTAGRAVGLPRRLHMKDSARAVLDPRLFEGAVELRYPSPVWAVDPGVHWSLPVLRPLEIGAVVLLGDPEAAPAVRSADAWSVVRDLATESSMFSRRPNALVAELSRVANNTRCVVIDGYFGARGAECIDAFV